jgi:hypothetical protein
MSEIKDQSHHVELDATAEKAGISAEDLELQQALRNYIPETEAEKKLRRKIDLHLMPMLWVMYVLNYIDRTNIVSS